MKLSIKTVIFTIAILALFVSCSNIPTADLAKPAPYAMFITLDTPGKLTSPMYYVHNNIIKKIDDGLYGLLLNQNAFVYLRQTAEMDNPELIYKNLKTDQTVKLITPDQFGTMISMLISPGRKKLAVHVWPDGIATGNNLFIILDTSNILNNPTKLNISLINKGKLYSSIKWIAAIGDDGSMVYVGSNGAPDEALVYRDIRGNEKIITKYKESNDFDAIITQGIHPPYEVAYIDSDSHTVYLLGKSGVYTFKPETGSLTLSYPLKSVPSEGLWIDNTSKKLLVWGYQIGKATIKVYNLDGKLIQTTSGAKYFDPRIIDGKIFGIGTIKEKTIYSYTIGEIHLGTATPSIDRIFISQDDIKWWDITAKR